MKKVVLITGASSGIGKEFAYKYVKNGYNLLLAARSKDILLSLKEELEEKYNINVFVYIIDLTIKNSILDLYNYTKENNLIVEILINNAGFGDFGQFVDCALDKQVNMINLNITSLVVLTRYFITDMKEKNYGKILNVASLASFMPGPYVSVYYATKSFVLSFSQAISEELKRYNIQVSALCPGPTSTNFEKKANVRFSNMKMSSSKYVVDYCYNKFMKSKKVIIIPGIRNKLLALSPKFFPSFIIRKIVYKIQNKFRNK